MFDIQSSDLPDTIHTVCRHIGQAGGHAWLVGGCVRDLMLDLPPKDFDLEVFGLPPDRLHQTLKQLGHTELVGRHFGVFKLWLSGLEMDIAMPRSELKSGHGHRGFDVTIDPDMTPEKASRRRDFSINAMMFDPLSHQLLDFHAGKADLKQRILRHIGTAFSEDPLRPLRAMQFAARFRLRLDQGTALLCKQMLGEVSSLSHTRIWGEWQKWSHAAYPSYGLQALRQSGWISLYPELEILIGCPQSPRWHPEGDVWAHTLQVCDQAAQIAARQQIDDNSLEYLLFSALCHDLGKPVTTVSNDSGTWSSPGHSEAGLQPSRHFMQQIGAPKRHIGYILPLVQDHITHLHGQPTERAVRRLAHRLKPAHIELWEMLVEADASGRFPAPPSRPALPWLNQAIAMQHQHTAPTPIVSGKLLLQLGIATPGSAMGKIIKLAYAAQLEGVFEDTDSAITWLNKTNPNNPPSE